jgi:hypothetical protein
MINTLMAFFSTGEEVDEAASEDFFRNVLKIENYDSAIVGRSLRPIAAQWLLCDVIPTIEPFLLPEHFWTECAMSWFFSAL